MNSTIGATRSNNWKRFKVQYIVAAAGVALAISAAIGFGELSKDDAATSPVTSPAQRVSQPVSQRSLSAVSLPDQLLVYRRGLGC